MIFAPLEARIFLPSSTSVPSRRTTSGTVKPIVFEDLVRIAEVEGEPVAFMLTLPDLNELIADLEAEAKDNDDQSDNAINDNKEKK